VRRPALGLGIVALFLSRPVPAHGSETTGPHDAPLAIGLFLVGASVLGASVYLDARGGVDRRFADAGVFAGLGATLSAIILYWA